MGDHMELVDGDAGVGELITLAVKQDDDIGVLTASIRLRAWSSGRASSGGMCAAGCSLSTASDSRARCTACSGCSVLSGG
jgi:hypothetical protein